MDNVQKVCHFNKTPSSQTFRIYPSSMLAVLVDLRELPKKAALM